MTYYKLRRKDTGQFFAEVMYPHQRRYNKFRWANIEGSRWKSISGMKNTMRQLKDAGLQPTNIEVVEYEVDPVEVKILQGRAVKGKGWVFEETNKIEKQIKEFKEEDLSNI